MNERDGESSFTVLFCNAQSYEVKIQKMDTVGFSEFGEYNMTTNCKM